MNDAVPAPVFSLLEQSASSVAPRTDTLFIAMLVLCGIIALALAGLILWLSVRYRAASAIDRANPPSHANGLEASWTIAPALIFLVFFAWGARDYVRSRHAPAQALPVYVVAKQWMWRIQHGNGRQEINQLHVPVDIPVVLVLASQDVIHSFYVPAFRLKQDVVPGRYTRLSFIATRVGDYQLFCSEYCGGQHSGMLGRVLVMRQQDYARWIDAAGDSGETTPAQRGAVLYRKLGCGNCHDSGSSAHAPPLEGLYGGMVTLADGATVTADDEYLREAIVEPARQRVRGQPALMPAYADRLSESQLQDLVAWLRAYGASGVRHD